MRSDNLILCHTFKYFRNMFLEIYDFHSTHFPSAFGLAWTAILKKTKGFRLGFCQTILRRAKANDN